MEIEEIQKLANDLITSHEIIIKENENKMKEIKNQIEKRTLQLFDHLFLNQVKLIEQNEKIEKNLNLKSNELIYKLKQFIQHHKTATEIEINETINEIKQERNQLDNLHYNYYFETDEKLEDVLTIGRLLSTSTEKSLIVIDQTELNIQETSDYSEQNSEFEKCPKIIREESNNEDVILATQMQSNLEYISNNNNNDEIIIISNNEELNDEDIYLIDGSDQLDDADFELEKSNAKKVRKYDLNQSSVSIPIDLNELELNAIFDMSLWKGINIKSKNPLNEKEISEDLKIVKDHLDDFMQKSIFDKYKHHTIARGLRKTTSGYTFIRDCEKSNEKCKSRWLLRINVSDKSAHLYCEFMCNHIAIKLTDIECGLLSIKTWKSIKYHKNISKADLNSTKKMKELRKIDNIFINYIKSLGKGQRFKECFKTKNGYSITRFCYQMKDLRCTSTWNLQVNVPSGQAEIYFSKRCDHFKI